MFEKEQGAHEAGSILDDLELGAAVRGAAFSWGELSQQHLKSFLDLAQRKGLSDEEAWKAYAILNSTREPHTENNG